jgi:hypothetical protein
MAEAGSGRLNRVHVTIRRGVVVIPWESRDQLLDQLRLLDDTKPIVAAFEAVGASRPVELDPAANAVLVEVIDLWMRNLAAIPAKLPPGIGELRDALRGDLDETSDREARTPRGSLPGERGQVATEAHR